MLAYFNMSLVFERKDIYPNFIVDVHKLLHKSGLVFKKGFCETEKDYIKEGMLPNIYPFAIVPYEFAKLFCEKVFYIEK